MPHLTGPKEAAQTELAERLAKLTARHRREIIDAAGWPPNYDRVPESLWERHEDELSDELAAVLLLLFVLGGSNLVALTARKSNSDALLRKGDEYAGRRATDVASRFSERTRNKFQEITRTTTTTTTKTTYRQAVVDLFGPQRIETLAKTETRQAITDGEQAAADEVKDTDDDGRKLVVPDAKRALVAYWNHDEYRPPGHAGAAVNPCPICTPLLGRPLSELPAPFRDGPPSHPNCDCALEWRDADGRKVAMRDDVDMATIDSLPPILKDYSRRKVIRWRRG